MANTKNIRTNAKVFGNFEATGDTAIGGNTVIQGNLNVIGSVSFGAGSTFNDSTFDVHDEADITKQVVFSLDAATTGTYTSIVASQTASRNITLPDASTALVGTDVSQTLTNKALVDASTSIVDDGDPTKAMKFEVAAITPASTRTITMPDADVNLGALTNSNIDAAAAIARSKIASGTMDHVIINDAGGALSSEATLAASRGGLATNASAFTGVIKAVAGVFSAAALVDADVDASAAIARSKLASGTAYRVIANNAAGVMSENAALTANYALYADANGQIASEAALDETRGGTAQTSYTAGDTLYAAASNTLAKRAIGTPGQIYKTGDAGIPVWEDTNYPTMETRLFEDWHTDAAGTLRWLDADTGVGASNTGLAVSDSSHQGILQLDNVGAAGAAIRYLGGVTSGSATAGFTLGGGILTMEWLARIEDLSTAGERFSFMLGMFDTATTQVNSIRFLYTDNVNAGNWTISAQNSGVTTNTDSGVAVVADTWYKLRAVVNAAATSIEYFINGVSVGTVSTNIPTVAIAPRATLVKSVGTASRVGYVDYFRLYQRLTSAR